MKKILMLALMVPLCAQAYTCRSPVVKRQFDVLSGHPKGRPGYIVDHICALANGGIDAVINMQYQTISEAKIKDRLENTTAGRLKWCTPENSTPTREVYNCIGKR
ncbi:hypothetical protein [uncultured Mucilaginibacter sp.]|uniref:hypothetical protein n=1 Tax=uncultured Mucilaginibacter sp. TaxID=797541 RepID=UPI0025D323F7|nr:hypothetical protein [uncultured Mucilaginibacter sp.]